MSECTEELEQDLFAWLDDISTGLKDGNLFDIDRTVTIIEEMLPNFVQDWTVRELCSAIRRK